MKANERIKYIIDNEGLNAKTLSERIGFDRPQAIYDILKNKTKSISENLANKILSVYPKYSRVWLLTGEGDISPQIEISGNNSPSFNVKSPIQITEPQTLDKALDALRESQCHITRLLGIIEKMQS